MTRWTVFVIALSLIVGSAFAAGTKHRKPATHTVLMEGMVFRPAVLALRTGDTVVWVNKDLVAHTATRTLAPGGFDSKLIQPGKSFKHTVRSRGALPYGCSLHPAMKATLQVK